MKYLRPILLIAVLLVGTAFAQTITEQLVRIQTDPASGRVQAYFARTVEIGGTVSPLEGWREVSWSIGAEKSVTVAGKTYTYSEVFAAVQAIALQEKAEQSAPPPSP